MLLLDEPFSNLDTALRVEVRAEIHQLLVELGITTVFVTHDQEEAFVLGDEVAVMLDGEIVQQSTPAGLYDEPATPWVASFVGDANLVAGRGRGHHADTGVGPVVLRTVTEGPVQVVLRPEELRLGASDEGGAPGVVELVEFYGHDCVTFARLDDGELIRVRAGSAPHYGRGDRVAVAYAGGPAVAFLAGHAPTAAEQEPQPTYK